MSELDKKLSDTLEVFNDLNNIHIFEDDTHGVLKKMYINTLDVLNNQFIHVENLVDNNNNNLLHLAASSCNIDFFLKAAAKGINPYLKNNDNRNAFQSRHYDFANTLWKKFEHIYFDSEVKKKSFSILTNGFHNIFKQAIYEKNIKINSSQYELIEISQFLKNNDIYSNKNVLLFALDKHNGKLTNLLSFIFEQQEELTPEENSIALHCCLKYMSMNSKKLEFNLLFDMFIENTEFAINEDFLQSMKYSAKNYNKSSFQEIFHKQTQILIDKKYDSKNNFEFYFSFHTKENDLRSIKNLSDFYTTLSLNSVWNYYYLKYKLQSKETTSIQIKKLKI